MEDGVYPTFFETGADLEEYCRAAGLHVAHGDTYGIVKWLQNYFGVGDEVDMDNTQHWGSRIYLVTEGLRILAIYQSRWNTEELCWIEVIREQVPGDAGRDGV